MSLEGKTKNWEFSKIDFYFFIGLVITTIGYAHFNSILVPVDEELDFFEILEAVQYWAIGIVAFFSHDVLIGNWKFFPKPTFP